MKAKEYLMQAKYLSLRIKAKANRLQELRDLAVTVTQVMTDMPKAKSSSTSRMEDTIVKIVDYQNEITEDMERLVSLQKEISSRIGQLGKSEYQVILNDRYLEGMDWQEIADDMHYTVRWVQSLHGEALIAMQELLEKTS